MTGFGAATLNEGTLAVRVEARSVNHRYLQVKARLPQEHGYLDGEVEALVRKHLERGAVSVTVSFERASGDAPARIDAEVAARYQVEIEALCTKLRLPNEIDLAALLALPGVVSTREDDALREREDELVLRCLERALKALVEMRSVEGASLARDLEKHAQAIAKIMTKLEKRMPKVLKEQHKKLTERVNELLDGKRRPSSRPEPVSEADLARELALLADRMDTSEEFARLQSHLSQLEKLLGSDKPVGRQLDFLVQEFFREANTIGSKCSDAEAAHAVVELKTTIERLREQVQNIE
jgi:uncharacterized protein (TIGR00255 family)